MAALGRRPGCGRAQSPVLAGPTGKNGQLSGGRGSCGVGPLGAAVPPRKNPTEGAETWSLAPAVLAAPALDSAHALHEPADHREEQIHPRDREQPALHDGTSTGWFSLGEPARPSALRNNR